MKIAQINALYPPNVVGGAEQSTSVLSEAMVALGHSLDIITLKGPLQEPVDSAIKVHEVPLANIYWPYNQPSRKPSLPEKMLWHGIDTANDIMAKRVTGILGKVQPDVVLTHNLQGFSTAVMPAIKKLGLPLVHVLHDFSLLCPQTTMVRNGKACGMHKERCKGCRLLTAPRFKHHLAADAVIGVSEDVLKTHVEHGLFVGKHQKAIYNALKPSITIADSLPIRAAGHVFTFGYLGRIEKSKGVETMLQAASKLERSGIRFRLRIAGNGNPEYLAFLRETWPLQCVDYVGYVNPAEFLPTLDTLIFPSEWREALGNGVFEAFACGVPVIGANIGGIPETIDHGTNGVVFAAGDFGLLAQYMYELLSSPGLLKRLATAALEKSHQYTPAFRAQEYLEFLATVIAATKQGAAA